MKRSTFGVRRSKVKVTEGQSAIWRPGVVIILDPLGRVLDPLGRVLDPLGRVLDPMGRAGFLVCVYYKYVKVCYILLDYVLTNVS